MAEVHDQKVSHMQREREREGGGGGETMNPKRDELIAPNCPGDANEYANPCIPTQTPWERLNDHL